MPGVGAERTADVGVAAGACLAGVAAGMDVGCGTRTLRGVGFGAGDATGVGVAVWPTTAGLVFWIVFPTPSWTVRRSV